MYTCMYVYIYIYTYIYIYIYVCFVQGPPVKGPPHYKPMCCCLASFM